MFSTDAMEYGRFLPDMPAPGDFSGAYPCLCVFEKASRRTAPVSDTLPGLIYLLSGSGYVEYLESRHTYLPDSLLAVPDMSLFVLDPLEDTEYLCLVLSQGGELIDQISQRAGAVLALEGDNGIDQKMGKLCFDLQSGQIASPYLLSARMYEILMGALAACENKKGGYPPLVRQAISIIREEYAFLAGVEELAQMLEVTKPHLIRTFTKATGMSPGKYLVQVKMENACLMLQNRDYSIDMIASMVGYSGANYFCRVFRQHTGESPGEYRARHFAPSTSREKEQKLKELEGIYHV